MKIIKKRKGQSMVEFSLVLPVFILLFLGMVQLSLILINTIMLKYTAYAVARVAVAYPEDDLKLTKAKQAKLAMVAMMTTVNNGNKIVSLDTLKELAAVYYKHEFAEDDIIVSVGKVDGIKIREFVIVDLKYNMPLKVPVVNRIFGLFHNDELYMTTRLISEKIKLPVREIRASAIMSIR